jgi:hypothetical protein
MPILSIDAMAFEPLHAARKRYLDALRPHTTSTKHARECLRVGGLDGFLDALAHLTAVQAGAILKQWQWKFPLLSPITTLDFLQGLEASGKIDVARQTPTWTLFQQAAKDPDVATLTWLLGRASLPTPQVHAQAGNLFHAFPLSGTDHQKAWVTGLRTALATPDALQHAADAFRPGYGFTTTSFPAPALATALFLLPLDGGTRQAILATLQAKGWSGHAIARWGVDVVGCLEHQGV